MNLWHLWNLWEILFAPAVNRQPPLQEGLSSQRNILCGQHHIPLLRAINFGILIRDEDDSLGRDAALVIGNPRCLAIGTLRLLDGHPHRHTDVDVQLLSGRILQMQQLALPDGVAAVQLASLLQCLLHILLVIHVHRGLEKEALGVGIALRAVVVSEAGVVDGSEGQLPLQFLPCLGRRLPVGNIHARHRLLATNLLHQSLQPRLGYQLVVHRQGLQGINPPHVSLACGIQSHYLFLFTHAKNSLY